MWAVNMEEPRAHGMSTRTASVASGAAGRLHAVLEAGLRLNDRSPAPTDGRADRKTLTALEKLKTDIIKRNKLGPNNLKVSHLDENTVDKNSYLWAVLYNHGMVWLSDSLRARVMDTWREVYAQVQTIDEDYDLSDSGDELEGAMDTEIAPALERWSEHAHAAYASFPEGSAAYTARLSAPEFKSVRNRVFAHAKRDLLRSWVSRELTVEQQKEQLTDLASLVATEILSIWKRGELGKEMHLGAWHHFALRDHIDVGDMQERRAEQNAKSDHKDHERVCPEINLQLVTLCELGPGEDVHH